MRTTRIGLTSLFFVGALFALSSVAVPARADFFDKECQGSCRDAIKTCVHAAKTAFRSCKEDCRGAEDRRACKRSCRPAIASAKGQCKEAREQCKNACEVEPPPPQECEHCRAELRVCLHEVGGAGRSCASDCISAKVQAARDCRFSGNIIGCLIGTARDAAVCLNGCAQDMRSGAHGCHVGHETCRDQCEGGTDPYGSASQAFLIPSDTLLW